MRRILLSFIVFVTIGLLYAPGVASSATLGPLTLPDIQIPASWQKPEQIRSKPGMAARGFRGQRDGHPRARYR